MKINWLWDSRLSENEVRKVLKDKNNPRFDIYAEKLFSRVNDPRVAFDIVNKITFCKKWPTIKKRMGKDRWLKNRVIFWQTIYEQVQQDLKMSGISIREPQQAKVPPERVKLAQQIRNIRIKLGYTQKEIAKKLGVIQQYISRIESGRENVSVSSLKRIADAFNKTLVIKLK